MSNATSIVTHNTLTVAKPLIEVRGMKLITSTKTGNSKVTIMPKREFIERWKANPANNGKPAKQATRDFDLYRSATLKEFNAQLALSISRGDIQAERLNADKTGDLRTVSLVRRDTREKDSVMDALRRTSEATGISLEELLKKAKEQGAVIPTAAETTVDISAQSGDGNKVEEHANLNEGAGRTQAGNSPESVETRT